MINATTFDKLLYLVGKTNLAGWKRGPDGRVWAGDHPLEEEPFAAALILAVVPHLPELLQSQLALYPERYRTRDL